MGRNKWYLYLAAVLVFFLLFYPLYHELSSLRRQEKELEKTLASGQKAHRQLEEILIRTQRVQKELLNADTAEFSSLLGEIAAIGGTAVTILSVVPQKPKLAGETVVLPVVLELEGSYPSLLEVFHKLGGANRPWVLQELSLEGKEGTIKAELNLLVPSGGEEAEVKS